VADGELVGLPGGNLTLIHIRNVHGDGLGALRREAWGGVLLTAM
jgi:hypothetical protein